VAPAPIGLEEVAGDVGFAAVVVAASIAVPAAARSAAVMATARARRREGRVRLVRRAVVRMAGWGGWMGRGVPLIAVVIEPPSREVPSGLIHPDLPAGARGGVIRRGRDGSVNAAGAQDPGAACTRA
jgi:hypothetical protein